MPLRKANYSNNPIIYTILIWKQLKKHFKLRNVSFLLLQIENPSFATSNLDGSFLAWKDLGICCVGDLYLEGVFASFQQLLEKYAFPQCDFIKYLQVRSYVRTHLPDFEGAGPDRLDSCLKYSNWTKNNNNFLPVQWTLEYSSNCN